MEVDALISRIFCITLRPVTAPGAIHPHGDVSHSPLVYLESLAEEAPFGMTSSLLDRMIVTRLIESPPPNYPQGPCDYLLSCYSRCVGESRVKAVVESQELASIVTSSKDLIVSYTMLCLQGLCPQPKEDDTRGALILLDSIDARNHWQSNASSSTSLSLPSPLNSPGSNGGPSGFSPQSSPLGVIQGYRAKPRVPMPPGFLEEFAAKHDSDGLDGVFLPIAKELAIRIRSTSPLGDFSSHLSSMSQLCRIEPIAISLVASKEFLPLLKDPMVLGRGIENPGISWLGPCFSISSIPDDLIYSLPSVASCFSGSGAERPSELTQTINAMRMAEKQIQNELHTIVKSLLGKSTREAMTQWLAAVIDGNMNRAKTQFETSKCASTGFFLNLTAVLLKLCGPFMDPSNPNFWKRTDVRFVTLNPLGLSFASDTKLGMTAEEDKAWRERVVSSLSAGSSSSPNTSQPGYSFICECFFLTARALRLGVVKVMTQLRPLNEQVAHIQQGVEVLEAELTRVSGTYREHEISFNLKRHREALAKMKALVYTSQGVITDPDLMGEVLAFYRLLVTWMMTIAYPQCQGNLSMLQTLPLPSPPPPEFTSLPEHFVEDMADIVLTLSQNFPSLLGQMQVKMEEIMLFLVVFISSPTYIKSSHLRSKLADILHAWLPQEDPTQGGTGRRPMTSRGRGRSQVEAGLQSLFGGHPMVITHMVPALLRLYVDVEFTDRNNAFYAKFSVRMKISEVLRYLWSLPQHKSAWLDFAKSQGHDTGDYVKFCNMLINDSIYLLDESLKKLSELKEKETLVGDPARLNAIPQREQQDLRAEMDQVGRTLRSLLIFAECSINLMTMTTEEITAPLLLPEMVSRLSNMLNYFLKYLTGTERRKLAIKDMEKYNFRPKELLLSIIKVYLHVFAADRSECFSRAIAEDERSYTVQMFPEAQKVLMSSGLLDISQQSALEQLASKVEAQLAIKGEQEDILADVEVPPEFLDPIMCTIMTDPVQAPTAGKSIYDRAVIVRLLLSDARDPNSREPLTPDMLIPQPELKKQIQEWILNQTRTKTKTRTRT